MYIHKNSVSSTLQTYTFYHGSYTSVEKQNACGAFSTRKTILENSLLHHHTQKQGLWEQQSFQKSAGFPLYFVYDTHPEEGYLKYLSSYKAYAQTNASQIAAAGSWTPWLCQAYPFNLKYFKNHSLQCLWLGDL